MTTLTTIAQNRCFGGVQGTYAHESTDDGMHDALRRLSAAAGGTRARCRCSIGFPD